MWPAACVTVLLLIAGGQALPSRTSVNVQDDRIIGGDETSIESFPYQVALSYFGDFRCGGSILSEKYILTAAHCLYDALSDWHVTVRAGSSNRAKGGQLVKAVKKMFEPRFTMQKLNYDVGLIKLEAPLALDGVTARPIRLVAVGPQPKPGSSITLSGWGTTKEGGDAPMVLRTTKVNVVQGWRCSVPYAMIVHITDAMFCASAGGKDSCQGDSGGPAVNDQGEQVGIVSFGNGCASWLSPGVYTNLANSEVRKFIDHAKTSMDAL